MDLENVACHVGLLVMLTPSVIAISVQINRFAERWEDRRRAGQFDQYMREIDDEYPKLWTSFSVETRKRN